LFPQPVLFGIARGEITLAFRRWDRPRILPGTRLRTAVGLVTIESVDEVDSAAIGEADARQAGFADRAELVSWLERATSRGRPAGEPGERRIFRIAVRHAGEDPRIALRAQDTLSADDRGALLARLARLDGTARGPWTARVLRLILQRPGVRAAELAESLGWERLGFKTDVRKLKELGLTESLEIGYRLSPRGRAILPALDDRPTGP
jgi:hypothetical protein